MNLQRRGSGPGGMLEKMFFSVWALGMIIGIAIGGGLVWAAIHFIRKFW